MIRRPLDLAEVAEIARADPTAFGRALGEVCDRFYLAMDEAGRRACLEPVPEPTGDPLVDAWIGAAGEHLAARWGLPVPAWTARGAHFRLDRAAYQPDSPRTNGILFVESPPAFRRRNLFVVAEPLTRARFPARLRARISLDPPVEDTATAVAPEPGP